MMTVPFAPSGDAVQDQNLWATDWTTWTVVSGPIIYDTASIELDGEYDSPLQHFSGIYVFNGGNPNVFRETIYGGPRNDHLVGRW